MCSVTKMNIKYFDTIHVTSGVCVLKSGFSASLVQNLGIMCSTNSKKLGMMYMLNHLLPFSWKLKRDFR